MPPRRRRLTHTLLLVGLLHLSPTVLADPLERIQQGDWVWSVALIKETELFYQSLGAWSAVTERCRSSVSDAEVAQVELFLPGWFQSQAGIFASNRSWAELLEDLKATGAATTQQRLGREKMSSMIDAAGGCRGQSVVPLTQNLARFLSGRAPASGKALEASILATSKIEPMRWGHRYFKDGETITTMAGNQMQADMESLAEQGFKTLMCYYDVDPASDYYHTQYHHVLDGTNVGIGHFVSFVVISGMQNRLSALNNYQPITHPVREFGPPRFECPTQPDPAFPTRELLKPRDNCAVNNAPVPTKQPEPTWDGRFRLFDYGMVPNDYNPPIPELAKTYTHIFVNFEKTKIGLLNGFRVRPYSAPLLPRSWDDYPAGSKEFDIAKEDILKPGQDGAKLLMCYYASELRSREKVRYHWWSEAYTTGFTAEYLKSRLPDHPLLYIGPPQAQCPPDDGTPQVETACSPEVPPPPPVTTSADPEPTLTREPSPPPTANKPEARQPTQAPTPRRAPPAPTREEPPQAPAKLPDRPYDVLGIKPGMSLAEAQEKLEQHAPMTSVYRLSRNPRDNWQPFGVKPFGRALIYVRLDDETLARANGSGRQSSKEAVEKRLEDLQEEFQQQLRNCDPAECAKYQQDYADKMRALMTELSSSRQQDSNYWRTAQPLETITLTLEKSASGEDAVFGIRRELRLPSGTQPAAVKKQLLAKYGEPSTENRNSWMWGSVEKRFCQPSPMEAIFQEWTHEEGAEIPRQMRLFTYTTGTNDGSWRKLPGDTRFSQCNTAVRATLSNDALGVEMTNNRMYFERFVDLFVNPKAADAEELDLTL